METLKPELTNKRAEREWKWICKKVGEAAALAAISKLGNRKAFPLNVARELGLKIPKEVSDEPPASREFALQKINEIKKKLANKN